MKISQMQTGEHIDVFCELLECVDNITKDKEFLKITMRLAQQKGVNMEAMTNQQVVLFLFDNKMSLVNVLLKSQFETTLKMISILSDKSVKELKEQKLVQTVLDAKECFNDRELIDFFKSQVVSTKEN